VAAQFCGTGKWVWSEAHIVPAGPILGASTAEAWTLGSAWLGGTHGGTIQTQKVQNTKF